jgi:hypothetical protein
MERRTTFTFVTDGIESALVQGRTAAGDRDVASAGGEARCSSSSRGLLDELPETAERDWRDLRQLVKAAADRPSGE